MSCREAETTTLLWVYGEGPENHLDHVGDCVDCQAVVAEHESVVGDIAGILPVLRRPEDEQAPAPANDNGAWLRWMAIGAAAAVAVMAVGSQVFTPAPQVVSEEVRADAIVLLDPFYGELDEELDALDYLVDSLAADSSIL